MKLLFQRPVVSERWRFQIVNAREEDITISEGTGSQKRTHKNDGSAQGQQGYESLTDPAMAVRMPEDVGSAGSTV